MCCPFLRMVHLANGTSPAIHICIEMKHFVFIFFFFIGCIKHCHGICQYKQSTIKVTAQDLYSQNKFNIIALWLKHLMINKSDGKFVWMSNIRCNQNKSKSSSEISPLLMSIIFIVLHECTIFERHKIIKCVDSNYLCLSSRTISSDNSCGVSHLHG